MARSKRFSAFFSLVLFLSLTPVTSFPCQLTVYAPELDVVLLPIATKQWRGAFGSVWKTELTIFNGSERTLGLNPGADPFVGPLIPFECLVSRCEEVVVTVPPDSVFNAGAALFTPPRAPFPGMFLYVNREISSKLSYSLRVRDVTREQDSWGTELPVVRSSKFRTARVQLLNVPLDDRFRQTLRIYEVSNTYPFAAHAPTSPQFMVRFFSMSGPSLGPLHELIVKPETTQLYTGISDSVIKGCAYTPLYPNYTEISGFRSNLPAAETAVRIEIEPLGDTKGFWAFVAVTNNETQHVTTVTPQ